MNNKLMYVLELTTKQHQAILEAIKNSKDDPDDFKRSLLQHNPFTGIQAPIIKKYSTEGLYELLASPYKIYEKFFWLWYNSFKYPKEIK